MLHAMFLLVKKEKILFRFTVLPSPFLGLYDRRPNWPPIILLHNDLKNSHRLLKCILAEELGHHFTEDGNVLAFANSDPYRYEEQEQSALMWAVERLVPLDKLITAANPGIISTRELAEYFDVTERFMGTALRLYGAF